MTTHVLIVDTVTFPIHLEHLFAGTGAGENVVDFNNAADTALPSAAAENNLVAMIADGSRIRRGDSIVFYLQQNRKRGIPEGKFFGVFQARHDGIFLDNNDDQQYLIDRLGKSLTFRTLIEPAAVYAEGVTEWEALDEIRTIRSPHQMLWSLIYRKLKGNRGNTMITLYEAERLVHLIRSKNGRQVLEVQDWTLSFDRDSQRIVLQDTARRPYDGRQVALNLLPRLTAKYRARQAFESHLQAYITQSLGRGTDANLDAALLGGAEVEWLGNEVSCGVGMQRIDIMASTVAGQQRTLIPVELKAVEAEAGNLGQIQRYIDWIEQYYIPNRPSDIQPALVAKQPANRAAAAFRGFARAAANFNRANESRTYPLKYVEFSVVAGNLHFEEVAL